MLTSSIKIRNSATRNIIYKYLCDTNEHPSAEMIYNDLKGELPNLSLGTVYRNLKQLEEIGRVIRVTSVDNRERYDASCEDHAHFVCEKCGRVIDIMNADINGIKMACKLSSSAKIKQIKMFLTEYVKTAQKIENEFHRNKYGELSGSSFFRFLKVVLSHLIKLEFLLRLPWSACTREQPGS